MGLHLVYVLGHGSLWADNELRYSLRSVEMFLPRVDHVTIAGSCPSFLRDVDHIPCRDVGRNPVTNSMAKLRFALDRIDGPLVLMNDDFYVLQPTRKLRHWHRGPLITKRGDSPYIHALNVTAKMLGPDALCYSVHVPFPFDAAKAGPVLDRCLENPHRPATFRSVYANTHPDAPALMADLKLKTVSDLGEQLAGRRFFSTSPSVVLHAEMQEWFARAFPQPSRWER